MAAIGAPDMAANAAVDGALDGDDDRVSFEVGESATTSATTSAIGGCRIPSASRTTRFARGNRKTRVSTANGANGRVRAAARGIGGSGECGRCLELPGPSKAETNTQSSARCEFGRRRLVTNRLPADAVSNSPPPLVELAAQRAAATLSFDTIEHSYHRLRPGCRIPEQVGRSLHILLTTHLRLAAPQAHSSTLLPRLLRGHSHLHVHNQRRANALQYGSRAL